MVKANFYQVEHTRPEDNYFSPENGEFETVNQAVTRILIHKFEGFMYRIVDVSTISGFRQVVLRIKYEEEIRVWSMEFNELYSKKDIEVPTKDKNNDNT